MLVMSIMQTYGLMHLLFESDLTCPLLASQVFDHAQQQTELAGNGAPTKVIVGVFLPMRQVWSNLIREWLNLLRRRCPDVAVHLLPGVDRLGFWPALRCAASLRKRCFGKIPVVYHCRGEVATTWGLRLRGLFHEDRVVLDVRGAWPLELLGHRGLAGPELAEGKDLADYRHAQHTLRAVIADADAITTVSSAMRDWLIHDQTAPEHTVIIPCCTKNVVDDSEREVVRARWNFQSSPVFLYSGSVKSYQHLDDLVLPFLRAVFEQSQNARAVFLTPQHEAMAALVRKAGLVTNRVVIESLPQHEVARAQTGADLGLLLKPPTALGRLFQPVKLAEYLASGLPVVVGEGMGLVPNILGSAGAGMAIKADGRSAVAAEAGRVLAWFAQEGAIARQAARRLATEEFLWASVTKRLRDLYAFALSQSRHRSSNVAPPR